MHRLLLFAVPSIARIEMGYEPIEGNSFGGGRTLWRSGSVVFAGKLFAQSRRCMSSKLPAGGGIHLLLGVGGVKGAVVKAETLNPQGRQQNS